MPEAAFNHIRYAIGVPLQFDNQHSLSRVFVLVGIGEIRQDSLLAMASITIEKVTPRLAISTSFLLESKANSIYVIFLSMCAHCQYEAMPFLMRCKCPSRLAPGSR